MTIYEQLKEAGVPIGNHESDLYAKVTPESQEIVRNYEFRSNVTTFKNNIDGQRWYDIPFAYDPFWEKVKRLSSIRHPESTDAGIC